MMRWLIFIVIFVGWAVACSPRLASGLRKSDLKKDVAIITDKGTIIIRLSDSTPLHRNNFLSLVKKGFYDSLLFHRVIKGFMIQSGDPLSRHARPQEQLGNGDPGYTIPAEFRADLFHDKGALAAARESDDVNPKKASSGSQFYIVEGRTFSSGRLDTIAMRTNRPMTSEQKTIYMKTGGAPWLDGNYTVFGETIRGMSVVDSIASVLTDSSDRPIADIRILKMKLVRRVK